MAKLDPKQQLAVREILGGLRAAVGAIYPGMAGLPLSSAEEHLSMLPGERAKDILAAIKAARELDAAH